MTTAASVLRQPEDDTKSFQQHHWWMSAGSWLVLFDLGNAVDAWKPQIFRRRSEEHRNQGENVGGKKCFLFIFTLW